MDESDRLAARFEEHRPRLRAVAYRLLGSGSEADDAVQEAWIRLSRSDAAAIGSLEAWLVTTVGRVALNMLRARRTRREEPLGAHLPDPVVDRVDGPDPEREALLADSVGVALLVVLETLTPAERLSYVLHDMFSVPFDEIAGIIGRSPDAARQLASRGRRRIRDAEAAPGTGTAAQEEVVRAFLTAAREGDFGALVAVLDPGVVVREDSGTGMLVEVRGAENVARRARSVSQLGLDAWPALVDGGVGWVSMLGGEPFAVAAVTTRDGRVAAMDILTDPERLARLDLTGLRPRS
ncbi:sigma-70 family RNA polymerase sigma factor [Actinomadura welshii]|uniref:sigma-70 family RNA polymerase sigma factor n=1 Tax=Actinomadura welshii TaxID=3103817 RepID=UPI0003ACEACD|nr:sigma-70 family RNA polymerase sigma factor [Actinomadura madurae]